MTNFITDDLINANVRSKWISSATATGSSFTPIDFDGVHTQMTTIGTWVNDGAGTITIPANGTYRFTIGLSGTTSIAGNTVIYVYRNGSNVGTIAKGDSGGTDGQRFNGSLTVDCAKNDTVYLTHNDAGGFGFDNNSIETYLEIVRVADYSAGEPAGFGLATETKAGLVKDQSRFCKIYGTTAQNGNPDSSTVVKIYDSIASDVHSMADLGNNRIIPNLPGLYYCEGFAQSYGPGNNTVISNTVSMRKNGAGVYNASDFYNDGSSNLGGAFNFRRRVSGVLEFNGSTDYIDLTSNMDLTGGTWDLDGGGVTGGYLFAVRISSLPSLT